MCCSSFPFSLLFLISHSTIAPSPTRWNKKCLWESPTRTNPVNTRRKKMKKKEWKKERNDRSIKLNNWIAIHRNDGDIGEQWKSDGKKIESLTHFYVDLFFAFQPMLLENHLKFTNFNSLLLDNLLCLRTRETWVRTRRSKSEERKDKKKGNNNNNKITQWTLSVLNIRFNAMMLHYVCMHKVQMEKKKNIITMFIWGMLHALCTIQQQITEHTLSLSLSACVYLSFEMQKG